MLPSVNGSNSNNPFAYLQLGQQQATSAGGSQAQSDPLSALLGTLTGQVSPATSTTTSSTSATSPSSVSSPQFGPQTLQALLALQANSADPQSLLSQFANAATGTDPTSTQQGSGEHGRHHHHRMAANGTDGQTTGAAPDTLNSPSQSGSGTGNNALYRLLQMQAQLTPPAAVQSVTTA